MGVRGVTPLRCFPDVGLHRVKDRRRAGLDELHLLFQDVLLGLLQGAATSLQNVVHLQSQACPLLLSHQVKARDSVKRIKLCVVLRNSQ